MMYATKSRAITTVTTLFFNCFPKHLRPASIALLCIRWAIFALCTLVLASCTSVYDTPYPLQDIRLPRDDAAHAAPIEWWYYTGHLQLEPTAAQPSDAAAVLEEYGFMLTFFKAYTPPDLRIFGIPAYWLIPKGYVGHFALTDKNQQRFFMTERSSFEFREAGASHEELDVFLGDWFVRRAPDGVSHDIHAYMDDAALWLRLTPEKPAALHGNPPGIQSMGPGGISYYIAYTRMAAEGKLYYNCYAAGLGCERRHVRGQAWHDHQWGDFDVSSYAGWDWFSVQFDDNTELMLYLIREPSGAYIAREGSFIDAQGQTIALYPEDFRLSETGAIWESPDTGAIYPMGWQIEVPEFAIDISVEPVMLQQEMDTRATTGIVYWEGAVTVSGSHQGRGFVELTNYDLYPYGQTDENTPLQPLRGPLEGF